MVEKTGKLREMLAVEICLVTNVLSNGLGTRGRRIFSLKVCNLDNQIQTVKSRPEASKQQFALHNSMFSVSWFKNT